MWFTIIATATAVLVTFLATVALIGEQQQVGMLPVVPDGTVTIPETWPVEDGGNDLTSNLFAVHKGCSIHVERSTSPANDTGVYRTVMWCDPEVAWPRPEPGDEVVPDDFAFGMKDLICDIDIRYVDHLGDVAMDHLYLYHHCVLVDPGDEIHP